MALGFRACLAEVAETCDPSQVSVHRHDGTSFYPATGVATEVGFGAGAGLSWLLSLKLL